MYKFIIALVVLFFSAPAYAENEREALAKEIKAMISDLSCETSLQCKSVGFGSRACGGYNEYLIYSSQNVYDYILLKKTQRYVELDEKNNEDGGGVTICSVAQPRVAKCIAGKCKDMGDELNYNNSEKE